MKFLALTLFFCTSLQTFAVPKQNTTNKIKFHKPETDAEKALDIILRVENGVEKNSKLKHEDMFTKEFDEDYNRQRDISSNLNHCKLSCKKSYCFDCYVEKQLKKISPEPYYYDSKIKLKDKLIYSTNCSIKSKKCRILTKHGEYYMKRENENWKIDGFTFHAGNYDPDDISINVSYNN